MKIGDILIKVSDITPKKGIFLTLIKEYIYFSLIVGLIVIVLQHITILWMKETQRECLMIYWKMGYRIIGIIET